MVEQKFEFVEFRPFWEGRMNRCDVVEQFELAVNQSISDLCRYIGFALENMGYDRCQRTYIRHLGFKPEFEKLDAGRCLTQLLSVADGILCQDDCEIARDCDCNKVARPELGPNPALSKVAARVTALDNEKRSDMAQITDRRALRYYALRSLGLDTDPDAQKPQDRQNVLLNREVVHEDNG